jgi:hypothetical protein
MMLWKASLSFKYYLPLHVSIFGVKTYELCDAGTGGYLWSFLADAGSNTKLLTPLITADTKTKKKQHPLFQKLVEALQKQVQTVRMDNFSISLCVAYVLRTIFKTDCVGTLKLNPKTVSHKSEKKRRIINKQNHKKKFWTCFYYKIKLQETRHCAFCVSQS